MIRAVSKNALCSLDRVTLRLKEHLKTSNIQVSLTTFMIWSNLSRYLMKVDHQVLKEKKYY